jgi:hypothetical protein
MENIIQKACMLASGVTALNSTTSNSTITAFILIAVAIVVIIVILIVSFYPKNKHITQKNTPTSTEQPNSTREAPLPLQAEIRPIVCPHCGSKNLAYVSEYHKSIVGRIFTAIFLFLSIVLIGSSMLGNNSNTNSIATAFSAATLLFYVMVLIIESRTHVKAICKDCGNIWLLD